MHATIYTFRKGLRIELENFVARFAYLAILPWIS